MRARSRPRLLASAWGYQVFASGEPGKSRWAVFGPALPMTAEKVAHGRGSKAASTSRGATTRVATSSDDYRTVYRDVLAACDEPIILHWLGEMFDPALAGYWGSSSFEATMETALAVVEENASKVDGIKISPIELSHKCPMQKCTNGSTRIPTRS